MDVEDPLFVNRLEPIRELLALLPFTRPSARHRAPQVNHPDGWYNNGNGSQTTAWKAIMDAILVRYGDSGYQPTPALRRQVADNILSLVREAYGEQQGIRISIPAPHHAVVGSNQPPYSYLLWNISNEFRERALSDRYITTERGALFFTPNRAEIPTFITSIAHFEEADPAELRNHVDDALTRRGIDQFLCAVIPSHPTLSRMPLDEAVRRIRESMRIEIVRARQAGGAELLVAHIFIDSPTEDVATWGLLQELVESATFAHPLLGMEMAIFREWRCRFCHSMLHPGGLCHLLTEPGWTLPATFQNTQAATPPQLLPLPPAPADQGAADANVYTTVPPPQPGRGGAGGRGRGRGRGNGRGHGYGRGM